MGVLGEVRDGRTVMLVWPDMVSEWMFVGAEVNP